MGIVGARMAGDGVNPGQCSLEDELRNVPLIGL